jgi:prolyl-tRNA editing enzyme YbaK/EbsC (Cys-tRNA(Pro) deacylase)
MHDAVRRLEGKNAVGKKQYSIRMVSQEVSDALSGFPHNAVTPIGMAKPVLVLLSDKIKTLPEGKMWLGGGEVDLKVRLDVAEFVANFTSAGQPPQFADITD